MALTKPGDYITAKCGRCDDITGHVVMLILDGEIARVECKACGSVHKYRATKAVKAAGGHGGSVKRVRAGDSRDKAVELGAPRLVNRGGSAAEKRAENVKKASAAKVEAAWQEAMIRRGGETPVPYSMSGTFEKHTLVDHPVFGKGEVLHLLPPDKMEVLFQEGVKILRCKS